MPNPPFTTRERLAERILEARSTTFVRLSRSPGTAGPPMAWLDTADDLIWRARSWRKVFASNGLTPADRILHALPSDSAAARDCWAAAVDLGALSASSCSLSPEDLLQFAPTVLVSTPSDALRLAHLAAERHVELSDGSLRLTIVTGEPGGSIGSTRRRIEQQLGAHCLDVYQLLELGIVAWSCGSGDALHFDEAEFLVECLEPQSDRAAGKGELAELVITTRTPRGTPLARYRTGDLVRVDNSGCACGSPWMPAAGGVLGRLSERLLVRGVELLPATIEQVVFRHPAVVDYRLRVYQVRGECEVGVQVEAAGAIANEGDLARVATEVGEDLRRSLGLRLLTEAVTPGSLGDQDAGRRARRLSRQ